MSHSQVWYDPFTRVTWLIHMCDMTHTHMGDMMHTHLWDDSFIMMCKKMHSECICPQDASPAILERLFKDSNIFKIGYDSFGSLRIFSRMDMTHLLVWHDSFSGASLVLFAHHHHLKDLAHLLKTHCTCFQRCEIHTGWQKCIECLHVSFRKRATNCRALWQKMTYKEKMSHVFWPPCRWRNRLPSVARLTRVVCHDSLTCVPWLTHMCDMCVMTYPCVSWLTHPYSIMNSCVQLAV